MVAPLVIPIPTQGIDLDAVLGASPVVGLPKLPILEVKRGPICPDETPFVPHHPDPGVVHGGHPGC